MHGPFPREQIHALHPFSDAGAVRSYSSGPADGGHGVGRTLRYIHSRKLFIVEIIGLKNEIAEHSSGGEHSAAEQARSYFKEQLFGKSVFGCRRYLVNVASVDAGQFR